MDHSLDIGGVRVPGRVLMAPMTGITDLPLRQLASRLGAAYVATEMVACAELARGRPDVIRRAAVGAGLPLTVIQLVGRDPDMVAQGARMARAAGADIVDLNFGCPAKEVTGIQSGSALMRDPELACRLIDAAVTHAGGPVTVKMRLGWDDASRNAPDLAQRAEALGAAAVTVHGRTRAQFYSGQADWTAVAEVVQAVGIPVIVNGDIVDSQSARQALDRSGAAAVMIGRGVYGRPWLAPQIEAGLAGREIDEPDPAERLATVADHLASTLAFYGDGHGLKVFRKHLGHYVLNGPQPISGETQREAKARLCRLDTARDVEQALAALWGLAPAA